MEAVYSKIKDMLKAFYPVLYLTSFEYDRTKQKIEGIINVLRSEGKDVRIFNWNCVDGLRGLNGDKPQPVINGGLPAPRCRAPASSAIRRVRAPS